MQLINLDKLFGRVMQVHKCLVKADNSPDEILRSIARCEWQFLAAAGWPRDVSNHSSLVSSGSVSACGSLTDCTVHCRRLFKVVVAIAKLTCQLCKYCYYTVSQ